MIRLIVFVIVVLALGFGFSWIADRPGIVTINWQDAEYETSLMIAFSALVIILALAIIAWGLVSGLFKAPSLISRFFSNRKHERGIKAVSKGLVAAGMGDVATARKMAKESRRLIAHEPLVALLDAQTSLLEGNHKKAREGFKAMLDIEDTKLLGLRGLYLEAEREGLTEVAGQLAHQAAEDAPSLGWANLAKLRNLCQEGEWTDAIRTLEACRSAGIIDKETARSQKAVLLTARAEAEETANPELAAKLATEALRLDPKLVPAAIIGAIAHMRNNKLRKASKMIEQVWTKSPHPELADAYVHLRPGDSAADRQKRANALYKLRPQHPESSMALAEAYIEGQQWDDARDAMRPVLSNHLSERACLTMADIEEGQHGDRGRMRDWLSRAVKAPKNEVWTAEGYVSEKWLPISPVSGAIGAFEWKVPVQSLTEPAQNIEIGDLAEPLIAEQTSVAEPSTAGVVLPLTTLGDQNRKSAEDAGDEASEIHNNVIDISVHPIQDPQETNNNKNIQSADAEAEPVIVADEVQHQPSPKEGSDKTQEQSAQSVADRKDGDTQSAEESKETKSFGLQDDEGPESSGPKVHNTPSIKDQDDDPVIVKGEDGDSANKENGETSQSQSSSAQIKSKPVRSTQPKTGAVKVRKTDDHEGPGDGTYPMEHRPDDPGIDENLLEEKQGFRLF